MKTLISAFLLAVFVCAASAFCWLTLNQPVADPLASQKRDLKSLRIQRDIERLKIRQEEERRETAVTLAKLENQKRIESASPVLISGIISASFTRLFPVVAFLSASVGVLIYVRVRRVPFECASIKTSLPGHEVTQMVKASIHVQALAEAGKVSAFQDEVAGRKIAQAVSIAKAIRGNPQIENQNNEIQPVALSAELPHLCNIPTMQSILEGLKRGDSLVLGFDVETNEPIRGTFDALYSSFFVGRSGSGKSSWLRGIILQSLVCFPRIRFCILDPHQEHEESLSAGMPKTEHFQFLDTAKPYKGLYQFNEELQERLEQPAERDPLVLVVDEMSFCSRQKYAPTLQAVLERIANEGRKAKVYALLSSQDTRTRKTGDFRDMLSSSYIFQIKSSQARYLLQDADEVAKVKMIQERGIALFSPTNDESRLVRVPFCSTRDVCYIENCCGQESLNPLEKQPEPLPEQISEHAEQSNVQANIQDVFKSRMEKLNLSQNRLAEIASVPKSSLSVFMNSGMTTPQNLQKIESALNTLEEQARAAVM